LLTALDYGWGRDNVILNSMYFWRGLCFPFFILRVSPYWYASCREWAIILALVDLIKKILAGHKVRKAGGSFQLILTLLVTLRFLTLGRLIPFCYCVTGHLSVVARLAVPFWIATALRLFNANWTRFFSRYIVIERYVKSFIFQVIETITVLCRGITLGTRLRVNILVGAIFAKLFFIWSYALIRRNLVSDLLLSILAVTWAIVYYLCEWVVGCIQCLLFVYLLIIYVNDATFRATEKINYKWWKTKNKGA